jgi:four helix bundle protein
MLKLKLNRTLAFSLQHLALPSIGDCLKEIEETEYWLELLVDSGCVSAATMAGLLDETRQLIAIFTTIDKRSKGEL